MAWSKNLKNSVQSKLKLQIGSLQYSLPTGYYFLLAAYCLVLTV